jgi:adenylate cyclase
MDMGVLALLALTACKTILGHLDQGMEMGREAMARAKELGYPLVLAGAFGYLGLFHLYRRDPQASWKMGQACDCLATEQGFTYWTAVGKFCCSWALVEQGRVEKGIALMEQAIAITRASGCREARTLRLIMLAEAYGKNRQIEKALATVDEALAFVGTNAERAWESEAHRIRGRLFLVQGEESEAEACFQRALDVAAELEIKLYELRATVDLCHLWQGQGRQAEARERLAGIYSWFKEGFDAPDLIKARALLGELGETE